MSRLNSRNVRILDFTQASRLCRLHFSVLLILACAQSQGCGSGEHGIEDAWTTDSTVSDVDASDAPADDVTRGSAFGIFAGFTREFGDYEAAAGIDHAEYLDWAGDQYRALGAYWTRSNLQLVWDVVEPTMGGGYEWDNEMGTDEAFGAAAVAGVHYLAVFHEGGYLDPGLRRPDLNEEQYRRFVRDVVERYDGDGLDDAPGDVRIDHWQVGNESPQVEAMDGGVDAYVSWFTMTAEAVHEADPDAKMVVIAATDSSRVPDFTREVLTRLAEDGVRFDAVDVHHWGSADEVRIGACAGYESLLSTLGVDHVQIWSTEHGTHVGQPAPPEGTCMPECSAQQVCVQLGPEARCVPACTDSSQCPDPSYTCDLESGWCLQPAQTAREQAISLVQRYVVNRDLGVEKIFWNNLVAWNDFGGIAGGVYDRMGLVSGGFLEFETDADRGTPRLAWYAYRELAARTDGIVAQRLGPVDVGNEAAYVSAYRSLDSGTVGWVAWATSDPTSIHREVSGPGVRVIGFITGEDGSALRLETIDAADGSVTIALDAEPVWIEPL